MIVSVNMSRDVYEYYKDYNLDQVADKLLEMYDFTNLPAISMPREKECRINVSNEAYISLYETLGPRSKKVSLGRLFAFGYNVDVLSMPRFNEMRNVPSASPVPGLLDKAYRALLQACKYDNSAELKEITDLVYKYKEVIKCLA